MLQGAEQECLAEAEANKKQSREEVIARISAIKAVLGKTQHGQNQRYKRNGKGSEGGK